MSNEQYTVLNETNNEKEYPLFLGKSLGISRNDRLVYPQLEKLTQQQISYFWQPEEVDCSKDKADFRTLTDHEQHIFTANLKRQILLDSVQSRAPVLTFMKWVSAPELENWLLTWSFYEMIHSRSYSHIIKNVYTEPSKVFDGIMETPEILSCAADISKYYDVLMNNSGQVPFQVKRDIWLALMSVNILEGIRFYASFACSWNFAELKKMEGNAKIIKFIARDENLHLASTQQILKILATDDIEFKLIKDTTKDECIEMYRSVVNQENTFVDYIFKDGSMIGMNGDMLKSYIEWLANKRMKAVGLPPLYKIVNNPLPFTQKWIAGSDVQVAPQEVELSSYTVGQVKQDVTADTFKGLSL